MYPIIVRLFATGLRNLQVYVHNGTIRLLAAESVRCSLVTFMKACISHCALTCSRFSAVTGRHLRPMHLGETTGAVIACTNNLYDTATRSDG